MDIKEQQQLLLKIAIGAAWVDGHLEPQEIEYLEKLLKKSNFSYNSELDRLLVKPVPIEDTERWIVQYLTGSTNTDRMRLLSAIAEMLMADRNVSEIEHELLDQYHELMTEIPPYPEATPTLVQILGRFIKQLMRSIQKLTS